uniref:Uncharacterized protein n=1 Tax=Tanacetum cinerariifolium TaxID=118510 RepID=A0A6L2JMU1_TANCI|nr:hypothetical protein [Tanacetum cinerariifolium]
MIDHSQKWHDGSSTKNIDRTNNTEGIAAIVNKLDSLGQDMKMLKKNVHAIQVGFQLCRGAYLDKECPLNEEVKSVEEAVYANNEALIDNTSSNETNEVSFVANNKAQVAQEEDDVPTKVLPCQLPPKELNPRSFTLPCTMGSLNFYAMADLEWCSENSSPVTLTLIFYFDPRGLQTSTEGLSLQGMVIDKVKDPRSRSFDDYKWIFDLEVDQLADEYELGIGKKGHMLDNTLDNYKKVKGDNAYWRHDHGIEENERQERGVDIEEYDPPEVHVKILRISQQGNRIRGYINSYSCGKNVSGIRVCSGYTGQEIFSCHYHLEYRSTLKGVYCSSSTLIFEFHFFKCTIGTLYKPSRGMGVELPLDLYLPLIF